MVTNGTEDHQNVSRETFLSGSSKGVLIGSAGAASPILLFVRFFRSAFHCHEVEQPPAKSAFSGAVAENFTAFPPKLRSPLVADIARWSAAF